MKTKTVLPPETVPGLLVLLILLWSVARKANPMDTPAEMQNHLLAHEQGMYFIDAVQVAKQYVPDASLRWSHAFLDKDTNCTLVGHGVWHAAGTLSGDPKKVPTPPSWEMLFVPEESQPLFIRVGDRASGDPQAALRRAEADTGKLGGAQLGK